MVEAHETALGLSGWLSDERRLEVRVKGGGVGKTSGRFRFLGYTVGRQTREVAPRTVRRMMARVRAAVRAGAGEAETAALVASVRSSIGAMTF